MSDFFDVDNDDDEVEDKTVEEYLAYLKANLTFPCLLTDLEKLPDEEGFDGVGIVCEGINTTKYPNPKNTPGSSNTYELLDFDDEIDEDCGVLVKVKHLGDNETLTLPLIDFKATDTSSENYKLIDEYGTWFSFVISWG